MLIKTRKAQFGPDALVGVILVAIIGLGGLLMINIFVNSISIQGMITILDSELDQRCFYYLNSIQGSEYVRFGRDLRNVPEFNVLLEYSGGYRDNMEYSESFSRDMAEYSQILERSDFQVIGDITAFIATERKANALRRDIQDDWKMKEQRITRYCFIPVYSPVGTTGFAELFISESSGGGA